MHPPRDDYMATMTGGERSAFEAHAGWLRALLAEGVLRGEQAGKREGG